MDGQLVVVGIVLALAVGYLLRSTMKTWTGSKAGCGSGCGKCAVVEEPAGRRISLPRV